MDDPILEKQLSEDGTSIPSFGVVAVPENICSMCLRPEDIVGELVMHQVAYVFHASQKKICGECKDRLSRAISKTLALVGWD